MMAVELVLKFESDFLKKYPDMKFFNVNAVITDISQAYNILVAPEMRKSLRFFLASYLREDKDRFEAVGEEGFRVKANTKITSTDISNYREMRKLC